MNEFEAVRFERGLQIFLSDYEMEMERDEMRRGYLLNVVQKTFADKRDFEYRHPASWFDAILDAVGLKKFAHYKTVSFTILYPNFKPAMKDYQVHIGYE